MVVIYNSSYLNFLENEPAGFIPLFCFWLSMHAHPRVPTLYLFIVLFLLSARLAAAVQDSADNVVNYAYAAVFGTGVYDVKGQTAFVLRAPFYYPLRESSPERPGIKLLLPAMLGYYDYDYDSILNAGLPGGTALFGFVPGVEFEYEMNPSWRLRPYVQLGIGRDFRNNENARIHVAGVSSHYQLPSSGGWRFALGNSLVYAGYESAGGEAQSMGVMGIGVDAIYPWAVSLFGRETYLANYLVHYLYFDTLTFEQGNVSSAKVVGETELGLALGFVQQPRLLGVPFERVGLGFRYGDNIKGVRLITEFPF
jgi:hypothetical protein